MAANGISTLTIASGAILTKNINPPHTNAEIVPPYSAIWSLNYAGALGATDSVSYKLYVTSLGIGSAFTLTSHSTGDFAVTAGNFLYDEYGTSIGIIKGNATIDNYMAKAAAVCGSLNATIITAATYKGTWNAFTNTPTLTDGVGTLGDAYDTTVAGTSGAFPAYGEQDWRIYDGATWVRVAKTTTTEWTIKPAVGGLADKEARQTAKLDIAQAKREGRVVADDGSITGPIDSTKPYYRARNVYDPDRLPTQYSGYTVVDNANAEGLLRARPWTSYDINPTATIVNEGGTLTVNIALLEILDGTTVYWSVSNAGDFGTALGTFVVNNDSGSFTVTPTKDLSTEGTETFNIILRRGSSSGTVVATFSDVEITDVSLTPTITPAANSVNEGSSLSFAVTNLGPNGTYYWTINHVTTANADFVAVNGSFSLTGGGAQDNGTGSFSLSTVADNTTEGAQTFTVSVRSGSISGTVIVTSGSITVNDTSLTASGDTAGLYKTTYAGYFADVPAFFATATPATVGANPATSVQTTVIEEPGSDDGEGFSVQWLGYFKPTTTETHTFFLNSDDASYMWIGATAVTGFTTGNALINNGGGHAPQEVSGSIALTAGQYYPVRIQFGEQGGGDLLEFNYSTPTIVKTTTVTGKVFYNSATNGF